MLRRSFLSACFIIIFASVCAADLITVNWDGSADYTTIQAAIDAAADGDEVIVAQGTYYENINFNGKNIVLTSTNPTDPNTVADTIIDANGSGSVVTFSGSETSECQLTGFTITGGLSSSDGGGIYGNHAESVITNCIITDNQTNGYGGGLFRFDGEINNSEITNNTAQWYGGGLYQSDARIYHSVISNNYGSFGGGFYGCNGGIYNSVVEGNDASRGGAFSDCVIGVRESIVVDNSASIGGAFHDCLPYIIDSTIDDNYAYWGGGFYNCSGEIERCVIKSNFAIFDGGGLYGFNGNINNCIIRHNVAYYRGGGFYGGTAYSYDAIDNCTIYGNSAGISDEEGYYGSGVYGYDGPIRNCIIWANNSWKPDYSCYPQIYNCQVPSYSCIEMWTGEGIGNIDDYPHLNGLSGNYHLTLNSPCIDAGDPSILFSPYKTDIDGNYRVVGGRIDMGADEFCSADSALMILSTNSLVFTSLLDSGDPNDQSFVIKNYGQPDLNWSISVDSSWLNTTPSSGTTTFDGQEDITVSIDTSGLITGNYTGCITVTDPAAINSPQTITVNLDILGPNLWLSRRGFNFIVSSETLSAPDQILSIQNTGCDTLNWQIAEVPEVEWLGLDNYSGSSTGEVDEVILTVDPNGLANGLYECQLEVSDPVASNSPQTIYVSLRVYTPGVLRFPSEFDYLQDAAYFAQDGDHIIIEPGVHESPDFEYGDTFEIEIYDKYLTIRSENPDDPGSTATTVLRGYVFNFENPEDIEGQSAVKGITMQNSNGAIDAYDMPIVISNCLFKNCQGPVIRLYEYDVAGPRIVENCKITNNNFGTGDNFYWFSGCIMINRASASIRDCIITDNDMPGIFSGDLQSYDVGDLEIINCRVNRNGGLLPYYGETFYATTGGGVCNISGNLTIINSEFIGNVGDFGGAIYSDGYGYGTSMPVKYTYIANTLISGNRSFQPTEYRYAVMGGGICALQMYLFVDNCTITGNMADYGAGLGLGMNTEAIITNSIVYDNIGWIDGEQIGFSPPESPENLYYLGPADASVIYSDIQDGEPNYICPECNVEFGESNIDVDPEFVETGYWDPNDTLTDPNDDFWVEGDHHLKWDSPGINAGDPNYIPAEDELDIDGEPRVIGGRIDMGADEVGPKQADFTRDGRIDVSDLSVLSGSWGTQEGEQRWYALSDLFEDDVIGLDDLVLFVDDWMWQADWY